QVETTALHVHTDGRNRALVALGLCGHDVGLIPVTFQQDLRLRVKPTTSICFVRIGTTACTPPVLHRPIQLPGETGAQLMAQCQRLQPRGEREHVIPKARGWYAPHDVPDGRDRTDRIRWPDSCAWKEALMPNRPYQGRARRRRSR